MRLKSILIEGFRSFSRKAEINLDADVICLQGPNGVGKTSLLDAILWALVGRIDRFGDQATPVSLYAREGVARVVLTMAEGDRELVVSRSTDGESHSVRVRTAGEKLLEGRAAEAKLAAVLLPSYQERSGAEGVLSNVLTRGIYLQQDLVRQFVDSDTAADRFALISQVIGAGVVLDLQIALEKSRSQWSRNTTATTKEQFEPLVQQLSRVNEQLGRIDSDPSQDGVDIEGSLKLLHHSVQGYVRQGNLSQEPPTSASTLDRFLKELAAEHARMERELLAAKLLREEEGTFTTVPSECREELAQLVESERQISEQIGQCDAAIEIERSAIAIQQQNQLDEQDHAKRLANIAQLAIGELGSGEACPVCQQAHNLTSTIAHLQALISAATSPIQPSIESATLRILEEQKLELRQRLSDNQNRTRGLMAELKEVEERQLLFTSRVVALGIAAGQDMTVLLSARVEELTTQIGEVSRVLSSGESLSVRMVQLTEQRRRAELLHEKQSLEPRIAQVRRDIEQQDRTHALAGRIIEALRRAALEVTNEQIEQIKPLFQRIYSRIDPHPTLRITQMVASLERGKGLLRTGVSDFEESGKVYDALPILSSSQLNSFAVSLFLALNLGLPSLGLKLTMLDDPLQSLDAINLLGLVDVLRRFREHRQIIVSTHDQRLLGLLQRKLRPVRVGERMLTIVFESWNKGGPIFRTVESTFDPNEHQAVLAA